MEDARAAAERALRRSYAKLVAFLAARSGDVAGAEDALADAFARALAHWPAKGVPASPEAWLLTVARRRLADSGRRRRTAAAAEPELARLAEGLEAAAAAQSDIPDQRLALLFVLAHPAIDANIRAPLMLQTVLGLSAERIAAAFLTAPAAMGQRLVRAKAKIRDAKIPFAIPGVEALPERLEAVLDAIYAAYSEGWSDPGGADLARRGLTGEAIYLARLAAELAPDQPEALGLLALVLFAESRRNSRRDAAGRYAPLAEQDVALWDARLIAEAEAALARAGGLRRIGRYQLEAALQSAHVHRRRTGEGNWGEIARLYDALVALTGSPVAAINRALALAEVEGPQSGLAALPELGQHARLSDYQPYWAAKADLLARSGRPGDARRAYDLAIALEPDPAVRLFLESRRDA